MNEQDLFSFDSELPEWYGDAPSKLIQPVGQALGSVSNNPGPTNTSTAAPEIGNYGDGRLSRRERDLFAQSYAGLALTNGAKTSVTWQVGEWWYSYNSSTGATLVGKTSDTMKASTTSVTQTYIKTEGAKRLAALNAGTSSSGSSSTKKGMSTEDATALGAGVGAGLGELATRLSTLLAPAAAAPLTTEDLTLAPGGEETTESGLPWGWIIGGGVALLAVGGVVYALRRGGKSTSDEG